MFLIVDPTTKLYVFTENDPREDGFDGQVEFEVELDDTGTLSGRAQDATTAVPCLGRSPTNDKQYRVFESLKDCRAQGFETVAQVYGKYVSWKEFLEDT